MDKNFRLFGKISIVDIGFVLIVAGIIYAGYHLSLPQTISAQTGGTAVRFTAELHAKHPLFLDSVHVGETVFDSLRGTVIGTVADVYSGPYMEEVMDFENEIIRRVPIGDLISIYVVIQADAQVTDAATMVGQFPVMVGREAFIRTRSFASGAFIVRLEREGDGEW